MSDEDWEREISTMWRASLLTRQFVDGTIAPGDYYDGIADLGYDPYDLEQYWEAGNSLGY